MQIPKPGFEESPPERRTVANHEPIRGHINRPEPEREPLDGINDDRIATCVLAPGLGYGPCSGDIAHSERETEDEKPVLA